jgi:hypothetical protein
MKKLAKAILGSMGYEMRKKSSNGKGPITNAQDVERLKLLVGTTPIRLHFGCGPRILKGWQNIDLAFEPFEAYLKYFKDTYSEDIRGGREDLYILNFLEDGLPLPDNSVDIIYHEDFFEHLTQRNQFLFLAESLRVLKVGGVHRINTPNILASMRDHSDFSKGAKGVYVQEWDQWDHYNVISPAILTDMAKMVGYSRIELNSKNQSILGSQLPPEYRPNPDDRLSEDSNVFADLIK